MKDDRIKLKIMFAQDARWVFCRVLGTFWIRTHSSVAFVACPTCKAIVGDPCTGDGEGPKVEVHYQRKRAAVKWRKGEKTVILTAIQELERKQRQEKIEQSEIRRQMQRKEKND